MPVREVKSQLSSRLERVKAPKCITTPCTVRERGYFLVYMLVSFFVFGRKVLKPWPCDCLRGEMWLTPVDVPMLSSHPTVQLVLAEVERVQIMPLLDRLWGGNECVTVVKLPFSSRRAFIPVAHASLRQRSPRSVGAKQSPGASR